LLDQKVPKNQGFVKTAKIWRAILAGRNEPACLPQADRVEPFLPLL